MRYGARSTGVCPHCGITVQFVATSFVEAVPNFPISEIHRLRYHVGPETQKQIDPNQTKSIPADEILLQICVCPRSDCQGLVIAAVYLERNHEKNTWDEKEYLVYPRKANRKPVHSDVPKDIASDYEEACLVLPASPKASAALSRRCLQTVLRQQGFKQGDLSKQIEAAIPGLPNDIASALDAIRTIGNFASHPIKSQETGGIVPVAPGEADWSLEVLETLFDHYYERPAHLAAKRTSLNAKLEQAGKPPLKGPKT